MKPTFISETTKLLNEFKKTHPETEQAQQAGRARLWDKKIDPEQQKEFKEAKVNQKPYVYYNK
ncbi:DUF3460 family protein [Basilea psittacipulmonis]|uniref:Acetyl-CoA carboxylase carboxyl transferase subunit alpha n=1 Tax=Basilea psittacipulmonis DSM 24701 TaxID=1072685 RepID=A0A077DEU0_9BURK|nr:DUF3460 family protein [Basilea psittacipulmonis]AIL33234.1 acetyl-CoA carboxylase carboxyl transferase subunit alpha [Basilea psittacipulmonis DSM 24701]